MSAAFVFPPGSAGSDTLGPQVIAASWLLTSLSGAFLFMRVSAKLWTGRGLLVDDYLLFLAWVRTASASTLGRLFFFFIKKKFFSSLLTTHMSSWPFSSPP